MVGPLNLVRIFDRSVPNRFVQETLRCLYSAYRDADAQCRQDFPMPEAHDLRGHLRRAMFERNWRTLATRYLDLSASAVRNHRRTSYYTQIVSGCVVLTESAVETPEAMVRKAVFRQTLARSAQMVMPFVEHDLPAPDALLYAILLHGPADESTSSPGFVHIAFPSKDCSTYLDRIDLLKRYPNIAAEVRTDVPEIIDDEPEIRPIRRTRAEESDR